MIFSLPFRSFRFSISCALYHSLYHSVYQGVSSVSRVAIRSRTMWLRRRRPIIQRAFNCTVSFPFLVVCLIFCTWPFFSLSFVRILRTVSLSPFHLARSAVIYVHTSLCRSVCWPYSMALLWRCSLLAVLSSEGHSLLASDSFGFRFFRFFSLSLSLDSGFRLTSDSSLVSDRAGLLVLAYCVCSSHPPAAAIIESRKILKDTACNRIHSIGWSSQIYSLSSSPMIWVRSTQRVVQCRTLGASGALSGRTILSVCSPLASWS